MTKYQFSGLMASVGLCGVTPRRYRYSELLHTGTHAELMALGGRYAELYTLQASQYDVMAASVESAPRGQA